MAVTNETTVNKTKQAKEGKGWVRENLESIAVAIVLALIIRHFVLEAFKIPTGSMAPTLLGKHRDIKCDNCEYVFPLDVKASPFARCPLCGFRKRYDVRGSGGNRILVNKFIYDFTKPKRWDVIVFIYPLFEVSCGPCNYHASDISEEEANKGCPFCGGRLKKETKNYIKRLIGLPDEEVFVRNGDIYINGKIARKPRKVQDELWMPVYNSKYTPEHPTTYTEWDTDESPGHWKIRNGRFQVRAEGEDRPAYAAYDGRVTDVYGYNSRRSGRHAVGDLKLAFDILVTSVDSGSVRAVLEENENTFEAHLALNGTNPNAERRSFLKRTTGSETETMDVSQAGLLEPGKKYHVAFYNVDDSVGLELNGREIFSQEYDPKSGGVATRHGTSGVKIGVANARAVFENVAIYRDVYYTSDTGTFAVETPLHIGKHSYFVMGDNSPNSKDSRIWRCAPEKNLVGKAFLVFWPIKDMKIIR